MPEWVFIETAILKSARDSKGLSYESAAREFHISSKTYERYEKAGRIPRPLVPKVADLFGLEIEEPEIRRVVLDSPEVRVQAIEDLREYVGERLDAIEQTLEKLAVAIGIDVADTSEITLDRGRPSGLAGPAAEARAAAAAGHEAEEAAERAERGARPRRGRLTG